MELAFLLRHVILSSVASAFNIFSTLSHKPQDFRGNKIPNMKCAVWFSLHLSETWCKPCNCLLIMHISLDLQVAYKEIILKLFYQFTSTPISEAAQFKTWSCGRSFAGDAGSNPARAWMSVSYECCVLSGRVLCDGPITRPRVMCLSVIVKPRKLQPDPLQALLLRT